VSRIGSRRSTGPVLTLPTARASRCAREIVMPDKLVAPAATQKFLAELGKDRLHVPLPAVPAASLAAVNPRLLSASSDLYDCNATSATAPIRGISHDPSVMKIEADVITLVKPGVYLFSISVFFATYEPGETLDAYLARSSIWGKVRTVGVSIEAFSPYAFTAGWARSPNYGFESRQEDLLEFTRVFKTFANNPSNTKLRVRAGGAFGHSSDHPVVLRAAVRSLHIVPLQLLAA
jgi:hypothetical protein